MCHSLFCSGTKGIRAIHTILYVVMFLVKTSGEEGGCKNSREPPCPGEPTQTSDITSQLPMRTTTTTQNLLTKNHVYKYCTNSLVCDGNNYQILTNSRCWC